MSNIDAVTSKLSKFLVTEFQSIAMLDGFAVKNSIEFVNRLREETIKRTEVMLSFDVVSLYPNVPIPATLNYLNEWLAENGVEPNRAADLMKLTRLCMTQNVFTFRGTCWRIEDGTAMGNSLSPFLANLFLMFLERKLKLDKLFPRFWCRYVDDVFAIVPQRKVDDVLRMLNGTEFSSIKFTKELEQNDQLPFLDVLVQRKERRFEFSLRLNLFTAYNCFQLFKEISSINAHLKATFQTFYSASAFELRSSSRLSHYRMRESSWKSWLLYSQKLLDFVRKLSRQECFAVFQNSQKSAMLLRSLILVMAPQDSSAARTASMLTVNRHSSVDCSAAS